MVHAHIYRYIASEEANGESDTFIIKVQTVTQTDSCGLPVVARHGGDGFYSFVTPINRSRIFNCTLTDDPVVDYRLFATFAIS